MQVSFEGRGARWEGAAEIAERAENDKHQPWSLRVVSGSETVEGTMLVTDLASNAADEAAASSGEDVNAILGRAFSRSLVAELGLRPLASGFRFVVDHRWVTGY